MRPIVIYHARCPDGFCSAWVARLKFPDAEFLPMAHGDQPPDVEGRDVLIADFSFKRPIILKMKERAASLTVLDHHKTAQAELEGLEFCLFDMERSGARLTWDHLFSGIAPPWIVQYVEDRDLWRWSLPNSKVICALLETLPWGDFLAWDQMAQRNPESLEFLAEGGAILTFKDRALMDMVSHAQEVELAGHAVLGVNTPFMFSEVAGHLAKDRPFGVTWYQAEDGMYRYSLRTTPKEGVDVSEVAKKYGGGGHADAAGFDADQPVHKLLRRDEACHPPDLDAGTRLAESTSPEHGEVPSAG